MAKVKVGITLDEELLRRIDDYADDNYLNRSSLISFATNQFLNTSDVMKAIKSVSLAMQKIADTGKVDEETQRQLDDFQRLSKMMIGAK